MTIKAIILAGGRGTRLAEETGSRPKPMVEIGGRPVLWHLMQIYAANDVRDFVVACGYKGELIKEYFRSLLHVSNDFTIDLATGQIDTHNAATPTWRVSVVDTGLDTMTGGRIRRLQPWIGNETFMVTYGDGLGNVDIRALLAFHRAHGRLATVTAVRPPARFGGLVLQDSQVHQFSEKRQSDAGWINGGYFVFEPGVFDYLGADDTILEREPLERLTSEGQLMAFRHDGFWQPMDTLREKEQLEALWDSGDAPWRVWP